MTLRIFCASSIGRNCVDRKINGSTSAALAVASDKLAIKSGRPSNAGMLRRFLPERVIPSSNDHYVIIEKTGDQSSRKRNRPALNRRLGLLSEALTNGTGRDA